MSNRINETAEALFLFVMSIHNAELKKIQKLVSL